MIYYDINEIKDFFKNKENIELLNENKFDELFQNFKKYEDSNYYYNNFSQFLIDADIDFIPYLVNLLLEMFTGVDFKNKNIVLNDKIFSIPNYCFSHSNIKSIELNNVEAIGVFAFEYCKNLKEIRFSDNLKLIDSAAFHNCTNLTKIKLPNSLESISGTAFVDCPNLNHIEWKGKVYTSKSSFIKEFNKSK